MLSFLLQLTMGKASLLLSKVNFVLDPNSSCFNKNLSPLYLFSHSFCLYCINSCFSTESVWLARKHVLLPVKTVTIKSHNKKPPWTPWTPSLNTTFLCPFIAKCCESAVCTLYPLPLLNPPQSSFPLIHISTSKQLLSRSTTQFIIYTG